METVNGVNFNLNDSKKKRLVGVLSKLLGKDIEAEVTRQLETIEQDVIAGSLSARTNQVLQRIYKSTGVQEGVIIKEKTGMRFFASCGHVIHDFSEVGGKCMIDDCEALVCKGCARICKRCMKLLCPKHQKLHKEKVYCPRCKLIVMFLGGLL